MLKQLVVRGCAVAALSVGLAANAAEAERFERVEGALRAAFAGAECSFQCERALKRLELAKRLEEPRFAAVPTQTDELEMFGRYFEEEMSLWKSYPLNPSVTPQRLNVADFGAKGDGETDDSPAFAKAIAAARALKGAPAVLEIPAGTFFLSSDRNWPEWYRAHAVVFGCTNLVVSGVSPEKTRLVFGDWSCPGFMVAHSCNVTLRGFETYFKKTPFTQGRIESHDVEKGELVIRLQEGTLRPDDPVYPREVSYPELCCSAYRDDGSIVLGDLAFWDFRSEDLGDGRFKLFLVTKHANYRKAVFPVGAHAVIPARNKNGEIGRIHTSSRYCTFESIWVRNSPSGVFGAHGDFSACVRCRILPLRPEFKLSSNADAFFNTCGSYVAHCEFRGMNDDGANSHTTGNAILSRPDDHTLTYAPITRATRPDETMQVYHAQTGEILATLHAVATSCVQTNGKWICTTRFKEKIPDGIATEETPGVRALTEKERYELTRHGGQAKDVRPADYIFQPLGHGIGYVAYDNVFANIRGIGVNSQCPNTLIDGNRFENCNNAIVLSALMSWHEGVPPHNVLIRGNRFRDHLHGVLAMHPTVCSLPAKADSFKGVAVVSNRFENVDRLLALGSFCRDIEVRDNEVTRDDSTGVPVTRVGAINWDCSLPSSTYFGHYATQSLGPEKFRDRTPYYAKVVGKDRIDYADRTVAEYEVEMRHAIAAGLDYFAYCWYDRTPPPGHIVSGATVAADDHVRELVRARQLHVQSPLRDRLHLCAIVICCHPYSDAELTALAETMKETYYEKIDGRPLVYLFASPWQETLSRLRTICRRVGAADPYAVLMTRRAPAGLRPGGEIQALGAYCGCTATAYVWEDYGARALEDNMKRAADGFPVVPSLCLGWDPTPRNERPVPWCSYAKGPYPRPATEAQWLADAAKTKAWIEASPKACPTGHALAFAWNEFEEGGWICPTLGPDGQPDCRRCEAFAKVVKLLKTPPSRFAETDRRLRSAFAGSEGSFQCERALKRLEMAKRLEEPRFAAVPTQADELEMFGRYFEEEMSLWRSYPLNPSVTPRRLNVAAFGAKGDGVTDDAPAFAKAIAAARALKGAPVVVEIPEGTYFLRDDCGRKDGFRAHVVLEGCTNLVLAGASPEKTHLVFGDDEMSGLMLAKCDNVCVRNLDLHWQKTPFTQGRIESYDVEKGELVIRLQNGTLRPDDPYYKHVSYPELCCSAHRDDGSIVLGALAFWDLRCEDLGDGRFKLFLVTKHANYRRAEFPVGAHAVIPARCGKASACYIHETSRFCAFDSVWVRNAPSAGFIAFGDFSSAYRCRVFPLRPEYKLSTDADAFFNASGAHVSHCEFRGMNDDAANSHTTGKPLIAQPDERTLSYPAIYRETRPGDVVQVFQSQTGKTLATLHAETSTCVCTNGQWVSTTRFRERIPDGILTGDSPGVRALSKKERYDLTRHGGSLASVKTADLAFQPLGHGLGYIVCDNVFRSFRGICVNSQCPNTLVENNLFENVNNGVQLSALMNWREGVPPHSVVIRNNVFTNLLRGVAVSFIAASGARGEGDPFVGVAVVSNRFADVRLPLALGAYARDAEVWGNSVSRPVPATENERSVTMFVAITGKPTPADAERKLDELKAAGVDSFMFYPTSGMRLEYLGNEFFALARAFAAGAERRGMKMWLYDEYNWPSGSCRGRVPAEDDRFRLTQLSVHAAPGGGYEWKKTLAAPGWVNLLEPQAVRRFIERTHLEYERRLGRWILNGTVRGIFTDEPGHPGPITLPPKPLVNFRWYDGLEADYRAATGRDFRADVEAWVGDHGKGEVWRGYAKACGRRFRESYYDQIRAVTDRLGIAFTGHMIYDDRMDKCVLRNGDPLRAICGESFPGIDEILSIDRPDRIPFNLYAIADFATRRSGAGGMCELFACGPADMPPDRIRRLIWLCALHGITRYFTVMSWMDGSWMEKMRGFTTTVGEYQPWYREFRTILDEADRASACAAKTPIRDVAVRYPQDLLAEAAFDPAHAVPAYDRLLAALELGGLTPMVVAEDETTDLPIVLAFDRKGVFDERTARRFASVEEAADFVAAAHPELPRRRNVLVRRYADGTRAELDLNPPDLSLPAGEDVKADWKVTFDGPKRLRIPFGTNRTVRVRIPETVKGARLVARHHRPIPAEEEDGRVVSGPMCTPDLMSVPPPYRFAMDGKPVETPNLTEALVPSYNSMYRETEPFDLPAGEHEFSVLSGRDDVSYFVPSLFLVGDFGGDSLKQFAGRITYAAEVEVPADAVRLAVDTGNAMTRVTLGGVDLGARGWAPFVWTVPTDCRGRKARLEIAVYTSVWPMYGEPLPGQGFLKLPDNLSDETSDPGLKGCRFVVENK